MNKLVFEVNNGRKLELVQREDNGTTLICSLDVPQVRASDIDTIRNNCLRNGYKEALK